VAPGAGRAKAARVRNELGEGKMPATSMAEVRGRARRHRVRHRAPARTGGGVAHLAHPADALAVRGRLLPDRHAAAMEQAVSWALAPSYVFEAMRALASGRAVSWPAWGGGRSLPSGEHALGVGLRARLPPRGAHGSHRAPQRGDRELIARPARLAPHHPEGRGPRGRPSTLRVLLATAPVLSSPAPSPVEREGARGGGVTRARAALAGRGRPVRPPRRTRLACSTALARDMGRQGIGEATHTPSRLHHATPTAGR
jgi:hypothetical protein